MNAFNELSVEKLCEVIHKLETKEDVKSFFMDLCTVYEIMDMAKRFEAAILLDKKTSYNDIMEKIDISTATLSRVSKSLNFGTGGYKKAVDIITNKKT